MEVRKYRAETITEAMEKVKNSLGPEAMIISTKSLRQGAEHHGYEIAAANSSNIGMKTSVLLNEAKSQLMSVREMIYLINQSSAVTEKIIMNPSGLDIYARLVRNGVNEWCAKVILERCGALTECPDVEFGGMGKKAIKEIMKMVEVKEPFETKDNARVIAAFVGTTGVGKTTTIAKLAAQIMLKGEKKVGLMSIDSYRIGAMEQLRIYANILGIACWPAFTKKEVLFGLKRMEGRDVVLIDTAGQSQYDMCRMEELRQMVADRSDISCHLLLNVATTDTEMHKTAINFGPLNIQSYIFTKIDEAETCGSILNQVMKLNLPISYLTTGQNVPDDIRRASKERIVSLVFNRNLSRCIGE